MCPAKDCARNDESSNSNRRGRWIDVRRSWSWVNHVYGASLAMYSHMDERLCCVLGHLRAVGKQTPDGGSAFRLSGAPQGLARRRPGLQSETARKNSRPKRETIATAA